MNVTPPFVDRPTRQLDRVHPLASAYVRRRLEASGWSVEQEVPIGSPRTIGWIDLLGFDEQSATLLVKEIKTELLDIGQVQRSLAWYEREAGVAARRLGWRPRHVVSAVLVLASDENEETIMANRDLFARWLPLRATELLDRIQTPASWSAGERGLAMIDPRDRPREVAPTDPARGQAHGLALRRLPGRGQRGGLGESRRDSIRDERACPQPGSARIARGQARS